MTFNISIGPNLHDSDASSLSDEEDSSGVQVSPPSDGSHDYHDPYDGWAHLSYPDEIKPSDSASRPRTSRQARNRNQVRGLSSDRRHSTRRQFAPNREPVQRRSRRHPSSESPESIDSADEFGATYGRTSNERRFWSPATRGPGYARSSSPGPSYNYPNGAVPHGTYSHPGAPQPPSDQLIRFGHHGQNTQPPPYGHSAYGYNPSMPHAHGHPMPPFFLHDNQGGYHVRHPTPPSHLRSDGHSSPHHSITHHMPPSHGPMQYGGPPLGHNELVPYGPGNFYPFREPYAMVPGMPPPYFNNYPRVPSPSQIESNGSPAPPSTEPVKDEAMARLEQLIMDERMEREARDSREAERQAAIEKEAAEQAAREERAAHEKRITEVAAAQARAEAEQKAAEEAAIAKKEAEEAAAAAAAAATDKANAAAAEAVAAATAAAASKSAERKKPIKFKDAVGRKFSFPFDLCCTWKGMEELIRQAFLHIEIIGPHVAEGHYDLIGPNGDIILPQIWETIIEPDWAITMHMWPIPDKPKDPDPVPAEEPSGLEVSVPPQPSAVPAAETASPRKKLEGIGVKKPRPRAADPGAFARWMVGNHLGKSQKALKAGKKPKVVIQHGNCCRVM